MKKQALLAALACLPLVALAATPLAPAQVSVTTDPAVTVKVTPRTSNTSKTVTVTVNKQDTVLQNGKQLYPVPPAHGGVPADPSSFPAPYLGRGDDELIQGQVPNPSGDGSGDFRTVCLTAHYAWDDPIVFPGKPGASHLHTFFGNTGTDAFSTAASIAGAGNSTCRGGTINRTAYWAPTMIDTATHKVVAPASMIVYYKTGYQILDNSLFKPPPVGLKMIAGSSGATTEQTNGPASFVCIEPVSGQGPRTYFLPTDCAPGNTIWQSVGFPQCWDGVNLDSADHKSHMAYPSQVQQPPFGWICDAAHPVVLPQITVNVLYVVPATGTKTWRLASDMYDPSKPAGYSLHSDWMMGWKPDIAATWTTNCLNAGKDCQAHMLGDGRVMVEFDGN